jgi:hypothetical protein
VPVPSVAGIVKRRVMSRCVWFEDVRERRCWERVKDDMTVGEGFGGADDTGRPKWCCDVVLL